MHLLKWNCDVMSLLGGMGHQRIVLFFITYGESISDSMINSQFLGNNWVKDIMDDTFFYIGLRTIRL